jgi:hypothetical protein
MFLSYKHMFIDFICSFSARGPNLPHVLNSSNGPHKKILHLATARSVMYHITPRLKGIQASLYADDAVIFVSPRKQDLEALKEILSFLGRPWGFALTSKKRKNFQSVVVV